MTLARKPPLAKSAKVLIGLELFLSVGALGGGAALILSPDGSALGLPLSLLEHAAFEDFRIPGLILLVVNGLLPLVSAFGLLRRRPWGPASAMVVGLVLLGWIAAQVVLIRSFSPALHGGYLLLGVAIARLGFTLHHAGDDR